MDTISIAAFTLDGIYFPAQTLSVSVPCCAPPPGSITTLYDEEAWTYKGFNIQGYPLPGSSFNSTYVNYLTGSWDKYALGLTIYSSGNGYSSVDMLPYTGGELEVVSQTYVVPQNASVSEPMTLWLLALGIAALVMTHRRKYGY